MAFDGFIVNEIKKELNNTVVNGRISKINMPNKNEVVLIIDNDKKTYSLLLSLLSTPLVYITNKKYISPEKVFTFCMVLRKHLKKGIINEIIQKDFERCLEIKISNLNDFGEIVNYKLIIELMGKHSNIILTNENNIVIDCIKHITNNISSVRTLIPQSKYFLPNNCDKTSPFLYELFNEKEYTGTLYSFLISNFNGISPVFVKIIANDLNVNENENIKNIDKNTLLSTLKKYLDKAKDNNQFFILKNNDIYVDYYLFDSNIFNGIEKEYYSSISNLLENYYENKKSKERLLSNISNITSNINTINSRLKRKLKNQNEDLLECEKLDKYKLYGELLLSVNNNSKISNVLTVNNYYDNSNIDIPIDSSKTIIDNSNIYYKKYNKLKRRKEKLTEQIKITTEEINYLDEILLWINLSDNIDDINQIKEDLTSKGYLKTNKNNKSKKNSATMNILKYKSKDGYTIYVGKNNIQNDYIITNLASNGDYWFHAKNVPGSHVLIKLNKNKISDEACLCCARLASYYSSSKNSPHVEVDYLDVKNLKKVKGKGKGFVIFHSNYSVVVSPNIRDIEKID